MKKNSILGFFIIFIISFVVFSTYIQAYGVEVNRVVSNKIDTSQLLDLGLELTNTLDEDITIQLSDNIVFNNNGLNIECYEIIIPKNSTIFFNYSDIYEYKFNTPGIYSLNSTEIKYSYQNNSYEKTINETKIEVLGESQSVSQIINVYQCNSKRSINMQTINSNNGNFNVNFNSGGLNVNSYDKLKEMQENTDVTIKNKFKNNLLKNQKILDIINEEIREGYSYDDIDVNVLNETTGLFDLIFKDIKNNQKVISGKSEDMVIEITNDPLVVKNKMILPIFLALFLIWVVLSCVYLVLFKNNIKKDSVLELFKPKIENKENKIKFICKNNEECSILELIHEIKDLEEKVEIVAFLKKNKRYINNEDYKKYIYKKLDNNQIEELKEIIISSLKDFNKKL